MAMISRLVERLSSGQARCAGPESRVNATQPEVSINFFHDFEEIDIAFAIV